MLFAVVRRRRGSAAVLPAAAVALCMMLMLAGVPRASAQAPAAPAPSTVRLYVLDGGVLESDPARYRLTPRDVATTQLSVASYLIVHPRGVLMWDSGAVPDGEWKAGGTAVKHQLVLPNKEVRIVTLQKTLASQLTAIGYTPAMVTHVALSHYHWDHTANANAFAGATWLVPKAERDEMFAAKPFGNVRPDTYNALKGSRTVIVTADEHDVFGDGRVIIKRAPGHTPGHQVLYSSPRSHRRRRAVRRPLPLRGGTHAGTPADLRVQRGTDARGAGIGGRVPEEDRRHTVDPASSPGAYRAEEGAGLLRLGRRYPRSVVPGRRRPWASRITMPSGASRFMTIACSSNS